MEISCEIRDACVLPFEGEHGLHERGRHLAVAATDQSLSIDTKDTSISVLGRSRASLAGEFWIGKTRAHFSGRLRNVSAAALACNGNNAARP